MPIFAGLCLRTNSTTRRHAATCSGLYMPVQPGLMRPSRLTSVISVMTRPAPPSARLPRWTRCQSSGMPSSAEYWHIGETTTRFGTTMSRRRNGVNIGGGAGSAGTLTPVWLAALSANHASTCLTKFGSRSRRFSCVMRKRPRQHREGELDRLEPAEIALGLLEPLQADLRRALHGVDAGPALGLVGIERVVDLAVFLQRLRQRDRILHRELGARADREMRGVGGIAHQHDVLVVPVPVLDRREGAPQRAVLDEARSLELVAEQRLAIGDGLVLVGLVEAGALPRVLGALDDEGRVLLVVLIGVDAEQAVLVLLEDEGEGGKLQLGAQPHELVAAPVDLRPELRGVLGADPAN